METKTVGQKNTVSKHLRPRVIDQVTGWKLAITLPVPLIAWSRLMPAQASNKVSSACTRGYLRSLRGRSRSDTLLRDMNLDLIVSKLNQHHKRATYGAVAEIVGGIAQGVMAGRPKSPRDSWIVAKGSGAPTGYMPGQIHPECRRQISERPWDFISDGEILRNWLKTHWI